MQIERGKPATSGQHGLDRAAERGVEQRGEPASMHGSEVIVLPFRRRTLEDGTALARINE
jgi:hypothetical protein